jgi:hypothetical protein
MYLWAAALAIGSILVVFVDTRTGVVVALGIAALAALATRKRHKVSQ